MSSNLAQPKQRNPGKYVFGPCSFTSIKGVEAHTRAIRNRYARGATIDAPDDVAFLADLFACNVEANEKSGKGVKHFYWQKSPNHSTDCFWVARVEGPPTDFGLAACIRCIGVLNRLSLRAAVRVQIDAFRRQRLSACDTHFISDFSDKPFPVDQADVDHVPPFDDLVTNFFSERGIDLDATLLTRSVDGQSDPAWRDEALIDAFRALHSLHRLRLVSKRENQSDIKRAARPAAEPLL
ncbi:MAG: DUF3223 domain-containing protein [Opitutaceae bacterium]|nr:DUF3223 domain-containing protein [Opitutaceae bacterium]